MDDIFEIIFVLALICEALEYLKTIANAKKRKFWVQPNFLDRDINGFFAKNFSRLFNGDPKQFFSATRMNPETFEMLFNLTEKKLTKTSKRQPIPPKCRLFLTLTYLANGGSKQSYSKKFKMGLTSIKRIVNETCVAIWDILSPVYLAISKQEKWKSTASDFERIWNLPNCIGAIDGKHITSLCPQRSFVLLGVCDANYSFIGFDIGANGEQNDGGIEWHLNFSQLLFDGRLDLPMDRSLPGTSRRLPHFFAGDASFPLKQYLMRPYPGTLLPADRVHFNKRLSRAHQAIENTFGVLVARWRILLSPLQMSPVSAENIIKAAIILHNFLRRHDKYYCPSDFVDSYQGDEIVNGLWRSEIATPLEKLKLMHSNNASRVAFAQRDDLKNYLFNN